MAGVAKAVAAAIHEPWDAAFVEMTDCPEGVVFTAEAVLTDGRILEFPLGADFQHAFDAWKRNFAESGLFIRGRARLDFLSSGNFGFQWGYDEPDDWRRRVDDVLKPLYGLD